MIVDPALLLAFIPAALALNLTPGADMMFCLGQGLKGGPRAALAADAGIAFGCMIHVLIAGAGLGAVIARVPGAFDVIRWVGVGYLLWLAFGAWRHKPGAVLPAVLPAMAFREGLFVNLTNPKVILFVLAFVPQFVVVSQPVLPQFLIFGLVLSGGGLIVNGLVGVFAGGIGRQVAGSPTAARWLGRISAGIFVALAAKLAFLQKG